jgi:uncharacterized protein YkwD
MSFRPRPTLRLLTVVGSVLMFAVLSSAPTAAVTSIASTYPKQERYALSLVNCLRTGGWVKSDGTCQAGHRIDRKPLKFSERLASEISRPQTRRLARAGSITNGHYLGGSILTRFNRAGITCCQRGENLGHNMIGIRKSIIWIDRQMQGEGPGGPHYDNFTDRRYKYVGIGVWKDGHDVWVAYDFWDGKTHW